jgi:hypothetical protein
MDFYSKIMGLPFVYKKLRPFLLGFNEKVDFKVIYDQLEIADCDIIADIGCGMGNALEYLPAFCEYHGFDTDGTALTELKKNYSLSNIFLYHRPFLLEDSIRINPSKVCMFGLLHHLNDIEVKALLNDVSQSPSLKKVVTCDPFIGGGKLNTLLTKLDRGQFGRTIAHYRALVPESLAIDNDGICNAGPFVKLYRMTIQKNF